MKRLLTQFAAFILGAYGVALRVTCRIHLHHDKRAEVAERGFRYVFGTGHAYQISGLVSADRGTGAMVSRSRDGGMVVPMLKWCGHVPIRGSSGTGRKGGGPALQALIKHVIAGHSAMLAFDGPRGPRGEVQRGLAMLASKTNSAVFFALGRPSRRLILRKTWDRFQIPLPFSRIDLYFSEPITMNSQETLDQFRNRLQVVWDELELRYDPDEASAASLTNRFDQQSAA